MDNVDQAGFDNLFGSGQTPICRLLGMIGLDLTSLFRHEFKQLADGDQLNGKARTHFQHSEVESPLKSSPTYSRYHSSNCVTIA